MSVEHNHQPDQQQTDIAQVIELSQQPLTEEEVAEKQLLDEAWIVDRHGDTPTAARLMGLTNLETRNSFILAADTTTAYIQQESVYYGRVTGIRDKSNRIEVLGHRITCQQVLEQRTLHTAQQRHPDFQPVEDKTCAHYRDYIVEADNLDRAVKVGWTAEEIEFRARSNERSFNEQLEYMGLLEIGKKLGFEDIENANWKYIVCRLLNMPLSTTNFEILDRIQELKPILKQIEPREEHKRLLGHADE